jgi:phosphatidylinositol 4-kinase
LVASQNGGLIEVVPNSISVHSIKKSMLLSLSKDGVRQESLSLKAHFIQQHGTYDSAEFRKASENFLYSLVGYSLLTYILQIRDRHNGNILIDREGHIIHIDFGFMLSNSPGYVGFESAPFKLTSDYIEILEGVGSVRWHHFKHLFLQGLLAVRKHSDRLVTLLELMMKDSPLPCFYSGETALLQFSERLHLTLTESQMEQLVERLVTTSALNVFTRLYDSYQYYTNGIL